MYTVKVICRKYSNDEKVSLGTSHTTRISSLIKLQEDGTAIHPLFSQLAPRRVYREICGCAVLTAFRDKGIMEEKAKQALKLNINCH